VRLPGLLPAWRLSELGSDSTNGRAEVMVGEGTLTISGVTASGGNSFAGSESGVTKTLLSVGS
jgi:hypothetical protein